MIGGLIALATATASLPLGPSISDQIAQRLEVAIEACVARMADAASLSRGTAGLKIATGGSVPLFAAIPGPPDWGNPTDYRVDSPGGEIWITNFPEKPVCRINAGDSDQIVTARQQVYRALVGSGAWTVGQAMSVPQGNGSVAFDRLVSSSNAGMKLLFSGPAKLMNDGSGLQLLVVVTVVNGKK